MTTALDDKQGLEIPALSTKEIKSALGNNHYWYADFLRYTSTRDLLDRLEAWQYTRLENIDHEGGRKFCELQIDDIRAELNRRRKFLARAKAADGYAPKWPTKQERVALDNQRKEAIRDRWPIDVFVSQVMFADLIPTSQGRFKACCPFPDHDDKTPSFNVDTTKQLAYCFGCKRGGDIFSLAEVYFQLNKFRDVIETLEGLSPVGRMAS